MGRSLELGLFVKRAGLCLGAAGVVFGLLAALSPRDADAYCRQRTCKETDLKTCEKDADECIIEGEYLYRDSPCLTFGVDKGSAKALKLTDDDFADVVAQAFSRWTDVDCGGGKHPALMVQSVGVVDVHGVYFCTELPELNLPVWTLVSPWTHQSAAVGFTSSIFDKSRDKGRVFDSDVELNLDRILGSFSLDEQRDVLLTVATHEAGHFLGLAHSADGYAVMAAEYSDIELLGRDITQDDVDGICSIYPPEDEALECSPPSYSDAALSEAQCAYVAGELSQDPSTSGPCSVARTGASGSGQQAGAFGIAAGLALLGARRRRRNS